MNDLYLTIADLPDDCADLECDSCGLYVANINPEIDGVCYYVAAFTAEEAELPERLCNTCADIKAKTYPGNVHDRREDAEHLIDSLAEWICWLVPRSVSAGVGRPLTGGAPPWSNATRKDGPYEVETLPHVQRKERAARPRAARCPHPHLHARAHLPDRREEEGQVIGYVYAKTLAARRSLARPTRRGDLLRYYRWRFWNFILGLLA